MKVIIELELGVDANEGLNDSELKAEIQQDLEKALHTESVLTAGFNILANAEVLEVHLES